MKWFVFDIIFCCRGTGSIEVRLEDGPGKCAGRVEIEYGGQWHRVTDDGWTSSNSDSVCRHLDCGAHRSTSAEKQSQNLDKFLGKAVQCPSSNSKISDCVGETSARPGKAVTVTCEGKWFYVCLFSALTSFTVLNCHSPICHLVTCHSSFIITEFAFLSELFLKRSPTDFKDDITALKYTQPNIVLEPTIRKILKIKSNFFNATMNGSIFKSLLFDMILATLSPLAISFNPFCLYFLLFFCFSSEHKMVFLDKQCNGEVGIEKGENTFWLSGHNKTWTKEAADAVCRQMHCGEYASHDSNPRGGRSEGVWPKSYNCSSNATSLFECDEEAHTGHIQHDTIATVKCKGNVRWYSNTQFHLICALCLLWPLFIMWPFYLGSMSKEIDALMSFCWKFIFVRYGQNLT